MAPRGRPPGLLINPAAARLVLDERGLSQAEIARRAGVSGAHLSQLLTGSKGAAEDVAVRIAEALDTEPGVLFPELVEFTTTVRHFTAPRATEPEDAA